jgi:DNA-binding IclR family transcriptional regulator
MNKGIQSIEIGFRVVDALVRNRGTVSLKKIAELCGMSPSKTRMYLVSLIRTGIIAQEPLGGYSLGPYAITLGVAALDQLDLFNRARQVMELIGRSREATCLLCTWTGFDIIIVGRSEGHNPLPVDFRIGGTASLTRTATGRTFLAFLPEEETRKLLGREMRENRRLEEYRHITQKWLREELTHVRQKGLSHSDKVVLGSGVSLAGYGAIAAPVCDPYGRLRFVLTVLHRHADAKQAKVIETRVRQALEMLPAPPQ